MNMKHYSSSNLSINQQYKFLSGSVIPRPIAWITTLDKKGETLNLAPFSFFNVAGKDTPLLMVSFFRKADGSLKDTAQNLMDTGEAVIHIVDEDSKWDMNETAAPMDKADSEVSRIQADLVPSETVKPPGLKQAKIRFEAKVHQYVPLQGDDNQTITDLFIFKVTDHYFDESIFDVEKEYILPDKLKPVARLSGSQYATLNEIYEMKRPTE